MEDGDYRGGTHKLEGDAKAHAIFNTLQSFELNKPQGLNLNWLPDVRSLTAGGRVRDGVKGQFHPHPEAPAPPSPPPFLFL